MKAIYTILNNKIYRINQDTSVPKTLASMPTKEHSVVSADTALKKMTATVFLNTMESTNIKSNKELYNMMKNTIRQHHITEIPVIYDRYMMLIDYQLFDSKCEICHNVVTKPVTASDAAILLGVAANNELVYRRVKEFDPIIEFATANQLPLGIMKTADTEYHFKINDISIYQDTSSVPGCCHNSIYCTPYSVNSASTVFDALSGFVCIYSTNAAGIQISDIDINFVPRTIDLKINFTLASLIVAYNDADIVTLVQEVINDKYHPQPPTPEVGPDGPDETLFPGKDHKPADGDYTPNRDGWYDYYERCLSTNPGALLVVEDLIPDISYKVDKMIKKHLVKKDIPDITVGEYVHYVEVYDDDDPHHHHHHHHDNHHHYEPMPEPTDDEEPTIDIGDTDDGNESFDVDDGNGDDTSTDYNSEIPSDQDRGATLDNSDTLSNRIDNMRGFTMLDLNEILL